ncbi:uncharacterized protein LOC131347676 isoform X1 [Hemibagrus wyckioides]|uniref:uncharacterized protein LOC131347676 isoform X1 n=1 Tax=Hemibagrus wyckioides TaxID=337641 RepID=UPI00266D1A8A|nr:uncharacterized protein LOC131347676 isoform X1 [Hemibagrus wyckioides]XP_058237954.1 uncharacterized protein LOC131347676 isoform X1 [Hemibagrus wyckioides]
MVLQCFTLLVFFLSSSHGHIEFIYTENEVELFCNTNKWQISTESQNNIDVNCTVKCAPGEPLRLNNIQKFCTNNESDKVDEKCLLIATSGFYQCVTALDSGCLYPFTPSPNTVTLYIIAPANESITTKSVERSSVELTEGDDVILNCSFILTEGYDNIYFAVYWIKTIEKNSICVHSYGYNERSIRYNAYCNGQKDLLHRLSNETPISRESHNIRISNVTKSDAGQYACALRLHENNKAGVMWKIINNITVIVHKGSELGNRLDFESLIRLCVTLPMILGVPIAVVVIHLWKKSKTSPRSQTMELRTIQEENL